MHPPGERLPHMYTEAFSLELYKGAVDSEGGVMEALGEGK